MSERDHGATPVHGGARLRVWAPRVARIAVRAGGRDRALARSPSGWFEAVLRGLRDGSEYLLLLEGERVRPDPASRRQPHGVHGASAVFDTHRFPWTDAGWRGIPQESLVFYELHVGTFTPEGTLDAAASRLPDLVELGVTCVELMPVQPFPGERNWGYDGVAPWAVHEAYGGPAALQRFVDRAHALGVAVCLDVVYNHLGPEGSYAPELGPYLTDRHHSAWGDGLDLDGADAAPVRGFFVGAAVQWVRDFHVDALRLDATHAIDDRSRRHLVQEICEAVRDDAHQSGRMVHVIAEDERNDRSVLDPPPAGWGCSAVWADDLHHSIHALLTGDRESYLQDYGTPEHVRAALAHGFGYRGELSRYRGRAHGTDPSGLSPARLVTCLQDHDQVGNRPEGERLASLVPWPALYPASTLVLLGSGTPLLFMGEEYGETRPFLYFTSHSDPALARAVSEGRKRELIARGADRVPDPQDRETFERSRLTHRRDGRHGQLREHYRRLLALRRKHLTAITARFPEVLVDGTAFTLRREALTVRANLGPRPAGGLAPWGFEIVEAPEAQADPVDPPHGFTSGDGRGLAP